MSLPGELDEAKALLQEADSAACAAEQDSQSIRSCPGSVDSSLDERRTRTQPAGRSPPPLECTRLLCLGSPLTPK